MTKCYLIFPNLLYTRLMEDTVFTENRKLKRQLDNLLRRARTNEQKQELFDSFGFEIIASNTPSQLRDYLLFQMQSRFQLQDVVLCLIDFERDAEKLFYGHDIDAKTIFESKLILLDPLTDKQKIDSISQYPALGSNLTVEFNWMVKGISDISETRSAAMLPLIRSNQLIGALLLLSRDEQRYQPGIATTFLQKLSAMTAVAIENCLNQQRIKEIGYQDSLTQAYNRRYFDLRFKDEIERALRKDENIACMFLDVDFFKKVNDTYGHQIGDLVLTRLVCLIKEQVRACDIVARYGGEEFAVVLPGVSSAGAKDIAERLRSAVEMDEHISPESGLRVTVSIGIQDMSNLAEGNISKDMIANYLLRDADQALYRAKESGRNKVLLHSDLD